jgi:hypothetical protein
VAEAVRHHGDHRRGRSPLTPRFRSRSRRSPLPNDFANGARLRTDILRNSGGRVAVTAPSETPVSQTSLTPSRTCSCRLVKREDRHPGDPHARRSDGHSVNQGVTRFAGFNDTHGSSSIRAATFSRLRSTPSVRRRAQSALSPCSMHHRKSVSVSSLPIISSTRRCDTPLAPCAATPLSFAHSRDLDEQ